jgi:hypothetical protein
MGISAIRQPTAVEVPEQRVTVAAALDPFIRPTTTVRRTNLVVVIAIVVIPVMMLVVAAVVVEVVAMCANVLEAPKT